MHTSVVQPAWRQVRWRTFTIPGSLCPAQRAGGCAPGWLKLGIRVQPGMERCHYRAGHAGIEGWSRLIGYA